MPSLDTTGWELESAEERNHLHPDRFHIPTLEERRGLLHGQMVKLLFLFMNHEEGRPIIDCERMWVTIINVSGGTYTGRLESLPSTSDLLKPGDVIEFEPQHVASVFVPGADPRHPDNLSSP